ncbi:MULTISPECIES: alcohol dehydrogenase catalytic domain-containing protein [unclassified Amycolatopsis]|uniref:alcohol dehydrogenase catalytic domain-containing protein n=1 Tax=unclassified Amycolatopsis TaxID=2618356 RepID=UPI00106EEEA2|nr:MULTISPECIES: alcohol dehydrogenase catalytic domain-containing protein [unclassified Amycolatopsis]
MRAVVLSAPGELAVAEVACPEPGSGEVLVKVAACGVCGHDQADRTGLLNLPLPAVLGHEIAGTVVAGGTRFAAGDRVAAKQFGTCGRCEPCAMGDELRCPQRAFLYGGFAEYAVLPESALLPVPPGVPLAEAAVVACAVGTGLQALRRVARVEPGETVLVTGAGGGLGLHAVQVAAALGARVLALTRSPDKAAQLGNAAQVVLAGETAGQDILDATDGRGVDVVLDNTGHQSVFRQAFRVLAHAGRYVLTGQVSGEPIRVHPAFVFEKEAVITGSGSTLMRTFADAMALVAEGRVRPVVTPYPLEAAARAFADRVTGRAVLVPSGGES